MYKDHEGANKAGLLTWRSSALLVAASALLMPSLARAVDVFVSMAPDGSQRWSTQAWDSSYAPAFRVGESERTLSGAPRVSKGPTRAYRHDTLVDQRRASIEPLAIDIARTHKVDPRLVLGVIEVESRFNTNAISPKGARGLMQLMPATAQRYGMRHTKDLHDPRINLDIGVRHLKDLLVEHQGNWALAAAAYNAGNGAVRRHGQRIPSYGETMLYVPSVLLRAQTVEARFQ